MRGLSNRQFITLAFIIMICGILIVGHDYFLAKKSSVYEEMSILLSDDLELMNEVEGEEDTSAPAGQTVSQTPPSSNSNSNSSSGSGDTSGRVRRANVTYNYVGRLIIPKINLNKGFVAYGTRGNNVDQNVAIVGGSTYPDEEGSNFILAAHSGTGWNAFFDYIDSLKPGDEAYVNYKGKQYAYKVAKTYTTPKNNGQVTLQKNSEKNQLTLITCKKPDYRSKYLIVLLELTYSTDL